MVAGVAPSATAAGMGSIISSMGPVGPMVQLAAEPERPSILEDPADSHRRIFKFDGELSQYRAWKSRIRDHASEDWPQWKQVLDHAERAGKELKVEDLQNLTLCGVNAQSLSSDLWSFLLRWLGPTLYLRPTTMGAQIEGNGLEIVA